MSAGTLALLAAASFAAGAINSVAGGGSLLSFPAAIACGMSPIVANATNTVAMAPASLLSAVAYRRELGAEKESLKRLAAPSLLGGGVGAMLLLHTPQSIFDAVVPFLILFAAALLLFQNLRRPNPNGEQSIPYWLAILMQFLVAVYGGYFGAGMGIMMLALYAALGATDFHRMNSLKTLLGGAINGIAAIAFIVSGSVAWKLGVMMLGCAAIGGYGGAVIARKINPQWVRWGVAAYGVVLAIALGWKRWGA